MDNFNTKIEQLESRIAKLENFNAKTKIVKEKDHKATWIFISIVGGVVFYICLLYLVLDMDSAAKFGDAFGAVNALFSGLAFAGVLVALFYQRNELALQREELKLTRLEMKSGNENTKEQAEAVKKQNELLEKQNELVKGDKKYKKLWEMYQDDIPVEIRSGNFKYLRSEGFDCFRGINFSGFDFANTNLSRCDFSGCSFVKASFQECKLQLCNFSGCDLNEVDFSGCSLEGSNFSGSRLRRVNLERAKVDNTNFGASYLSPARFYETEMTQEQQRVCGNLKDVVGLNK
ncbi:pentapeptide repeat-containing protein [Candidatus Uabimicrobium amorphum]|uniref:Pentapeptide repeat-containing protein n=1 Tax=Uabimicrobium amorphum TaxID=2596890 RepID=A0A5S9IS25_UABAM|nr:pentapeptide repeat-containing protein [Candidatus Uabimicrobium amorphum]BBM87103.1 hypothetical protein UABAM_05506 [Candidatus Uabimicrobium amorphum]